MELDRHDLIFCLRRLPGVFLDIVRSDKWSKSLFIGGGFIYAVIANEPINDVDIFVPSKEAADALAMEVKASMKVRKVHKTEFATTLVGTSPTLQIIHKWTYKDPREVIHSFDFTICQAVFWWENGKYHTHVSERFYKDLAAKRLVYTRPTRIEEAGGSMLRVLKYYQRGYRIPLDSLGAVIARLAVAVQWGRLLEQDKEGEAGKVLTGLLRSVDPLIDPTAEAHLPSQSKDDNDEDLPF